MINQLGAWVIQQACKDLQHIHRYLDKQLKFAVNISPNQLQATDFSRFVEEQTSTYNIDVSKLELEITESVLLNS